MRTIRALAMVGVFAACMTAAGDDDTTRDLNDLCLRVQRLLPAGWSAKIEPKLAGENGPPGMSELVVFRLAPLLGRWPRPSSPKGAGQPNQLELIRFLYLTMPYVSPTEHARIEAQNTANAKKQCDYVATLRAIPYGYKGAPPMPPDAFMPETAEQRRLVKAYAEFCRQVPVIALPDGYADKLSFECRTIPWFVCSDLKDQQELDDVRALVATLIKPYPQTPAQP